jgi:hypothetical protein
MMPGPPLTMSERLEREKMVLDFQRTVECGGERVPADVREQVDELSRAILDCHLEELEFLGIAQEIELGPFDFGDRGTSCKN